MKSDPSLTSQFFLPSTFSAKVKMNYKLRVISLDSAPEVFIYNPNEDFFIGRDKECDITLEEGGVSRKHALILQKRNKVYIRDLDSTNGIMINGEKVIEAALFPGDLIYIDRFQILYTESFSING